MLAAQVPNWLHSHSSVPHTAFDVHEGNMGERDVLCCVYRAMASELFLNMVKSCSAPMILLLAREQGGAAFQDSLVHCWPEV